jgi:hypothetical protein
LKAGDLDRIKHAAKNGHLTYGRHALERAKQRSVSRADVLRAIATSTDLEGQEDRKLRLKGGVDIDGDPLEVVVVEIQSGLFVVTVL